MGVEAGWEEDVETGADGPLEHGGGAAVEQRGGGFRGLSHLCPARGGMGR